MLSVIFVPIISAFLIFVLYLLLSPRRKADAPSAAQFQLKSALNLIDEKIDENNKMSFKEFKQLDMLVNKARSYLERAKFEDIYDMTVPLDACIEARAITQSLAIVLPENCAEYLNKVAHYLRVAADYIKTNCGISDVETSKMNLSAFSKKNKEDKAKAHLDSLDDKK